MIEGEVGDYLLTYTITNSNGNPITTTETVELLPGDPASIKLLSAAPLRAQVGKTFTPVPVAELRDAQGNRVRSDNQSAVVLELVSGSTVVASSSETVVVNGVATFAGISFSASVGDYTLRAKIVSSSAAVGETDSSGSFPLIHGDPNQFELIGDPGDAAYVVGSTYQNFGVKIMDAFGNLVDTDSNAELQLSVEEIEGEFQRHSGNRVSAVNGLATFSNYVLIARPGSYTVSVAVKWMGNDLTPVSDSFEVAVVHAAPAQLEVVQVRCRGPQQDRIRHSDKREDPGCI